MKVAFWWCMITFLLGVFIVALPDSGPPLFTIGGGHAPAPVDVVGLVLVIAPWAYMMFYALRKWRRVLTKLGRHVAAGTLMLAVMGLVVTAVFLSEEGPAWWIGAIIAFGGQLTWIGAAFRK